jgi:hypothetical protein
MRTAVNMRLDGAGLLVGLKGMTMTRNGMLLLSFGAAIELAGFCFAVADPLLACEFGPC